MQRRTRTDAFERVEHRVAYDGRELRVAVDRYRYPDGREAVREVVEVGDGVVVVARAADGVLMVAQPREAVGEPALLELVAGGVDDRDGGDVLAAAKRELSEEAGVGAAHWSYHGSFYTAPGDVDERMHLFVAWDLHPDTTGEQDDDERLTVQTVGFDALADLSWCRDAKSLIGLQLLSGMLRDDHRTALPARSPDGAGER